MPVYNKLVRDRIPEIIHEAPSDYMQKFEQENDNLEATMKTHFIDDLDAYGIWGDDYDTFFDKRIERIKEELEKRDY